MPASLHRYIYYAWITRSRGFFFFLFYFSFRAESWKQAKAPMTPAPGGMGNLNLTGIYKFGYSHLITPKDEESDSLCSQLNLTYWVVVNIKGVLKKIDATGNDRERRKGQLTPHSQIF